VRAARGRIERPSEASIRPVHDDIERILLDEHEIRAGVERVATEITAHYAHDEPAVIAVLKGSVIFVADLVRRLPLPLSLGFAWAESYREGTRAAPLELGGLPPAAELAGRRVLLVDDILDSGRTLAALRGELSARGARDVRTCVLLDKPARRAVDLDADHVGFRVADHFVVGYGLDFAGRYRNLPYLGTLRAEVLARAEVSR
jgi:hypoxanthine phosphoribosyltransferase